MRFCMFSDNDNYQIHVRGDLRRFALRMQGNMFKRTMLKLTRRLQRMLLCVHGYDGNDDHYDRAEYDYYDDRRQHVQRLGRHVHRFLQLPRELQIARKRDQLRRRHDVYRLLLRVHGRG